MFTLKLYQQDTVRLFPCEGVTIYRWENGSAQVSAYFKDASLDRAFAIGEPPTSNRDLNQSLEPSLIYDKAIVENAAGKTTEIVVPRGRGVVVTNRDPDSELCGYVGMGGQPSCRLPRGHKGDHAWKSTDTGKTLAEWREWMNENPDQDCDLCASGAPHQHLKDQPLRGTIHVNADGSAIQRTKP